jgi:hypothetical protein
MGFRKKRWRWRWLTLMFWVALFLALHQRIFNLRDACIEQQTAILIAIADNGLGYFSPTRPAAAALGYL